MFVARKSLIWTELLMVLLMDQVTERERRRLGLANEIKGAQIDAEAVAEFVADVVGAGDGRLIGRRSAGSRGVRRLHRNDVDQVLHSDEICRVAGVEAGTVGVRCRRDQ